MTKSLLTVRIGVTVTHAHDRALVERWSEHIMAISNLGSASSSPGTTTCPGSSTDPGSITSPRPVEVKDEIGTRTLVGQYKEEGAPGGGNSSRRLKFQTMMTL